MKFLRDIPIQQKLTLVFFITTSTALIFASVALFNYERKVYDNALKDELRTLAKITGENSAVAVTFVNPEEAAEILGSLRAQPQIVAAGLYDINGSLMTNYFRAGTTQNLPAHPTTGQEFIGGEDYLGHFAPIQKKTKERIGTIYLQADFRAVQERLKLYAEIVAMVLLVSFLVTFLISTRMVRFISRPILALADTAKKVTDRKDYSMRAEKMSNDELGIFTDDFNQMLAQIQSQDASLRRSNEELEQRVQERTQELQQLQRQNELILNSAGEGIYGLDLSGKITFANPAAAKMMGYSVTEMIGHSEHAVMFHSDSDGKSYAPENCPVCASFHAGESRQNSEEIFRRKDKSTFSAEFVRSAIFENGKQIGAVVLFKDISERKKAEEALASQTRDLARSNAELEQFAYVASHDLQEPLRMVSNYTQLLGRRYKDKLDNDAHEFINFAVDGAIRMQRLINDLLMYSRVGTQGKKFVKVDSTNLLGQAIVNLRGSIEEAHAIVSNDGLPDIIADPGQLVQLFQNLVGNAIKFRNKEIPLIHVSARRKADHWLFAVRDNGIGIDPQYAERIFIIFQRLHGQTEYAGTGIGLSICKKIIDRHGGKIWVESQEGHGAIFYFTIPIRGEPETEINEKQSPTRHSPG